MYRPSKRPPRGAWARHLQEQRKQRDLSAVEAFELVYERIGWSRKSRTAYVAIDSGDRQPKGNEVAVLGAEFGWPPEEDTSPELAGAPTDVIAYLARIDALVEQMAEERKVTLRLIALLEGRVPEPNPLSEEAEADAIADVELPAAEARLARTQSRRRRRDRPHLVEDPQ